MAPPNKNSSGNPDNRIRIWFALLVIIIGVFGVRLFYIQVIRYSHYKAAALSDQLKQYDIPATRGIIKIHDGNDVLPLVLNQQLYILFADPTFVKDPDAVAAKIVPIAGGDAADYAAKMKTKGGVRYVVLAKKLNSDQAKKIQALKSPGVGVVAQDFRAYPQGALASQTLGFVNDDGVGRYGIEQALNKQLKGTPGKLKAITDVNGVPLAASKDNIDIAPKNGSDVVLNLDFVMQQKMESILKTGVTRAGATGASAIIMDPNTGAVKAMANFPTYDPSNYSDVSDASLFDNGAVTHAIEPGSSMKTLTTSSALDQGVIKPSTTYYDPASWTVDGFKITNIEEDGGAGVKSLTDILNLSLNTGATWELMQMGGGQINEKARDAWYSYLTNHFMFGKETGIEQGYEASGYVPSPKDNGAGIDLTYANTAFGQAITTTPIQMGAALSAVLNGGTYYQPQLVGEYDNPDGSVTKVKPVVVKKNVVNSSIASTLEPIMEYTVSTHHFSPAIDQSLYKVGGKTGTAQIANPAGGYFDNNYNGTYVGYIGGNKVQYVIVVYVYNPTIGGYAGTAAAQPVFSDLAHMLIDSSYVTPKSQ